MTLLSAFLCITADWRHAFPQQRTFHRALGRPSARSSAWAAAA